MKKMTFPIGLAAAAAAAAYTHTHTHTNTSQPTASSPDGPSHCSTRAIKWGQTHAPVCAAPLHDLEPGSGLQPWHADGAAYRTVKNPWCSVSFTARIVPSAITPAQLEVPMAIVGTLLCVCLGRIQNIEPGAARAVREADENVGGAAPPDDLNIVGGVG